MEIRLHEEAQPGITQVKESKPENGYDEAHMQGSPGPHLGFRKILDFQFQPDGKQEQDDAHIRSRLKKRAGGETKSAEPQTGQQKTHQGRQAQPVQQVPHEECNGQDYRIHILLVTAPNQNSTA